MTSLPYPSFVNEIPVNDIRGVALSAAGSCRINPLAMKMISTMTTDKMTTSTSQEIAISVTTSNANKEYKLIFDKNKQQSTVDNLEDNDKEDITVNKDEKKKLKKKYMKQGIAMASKYLTSTLGLDVSIINVEIVLESSQIIDTDGCICACFLDAGCTSIVIDGTNPLNALDIAKIPKERLIATFSGDSSGDVTKGEIIQALTYASTISIDLSRKINTGSSGVLGNNNQVILDHIDTILSYIPDKNHKVIFELPSSPSSSSSTTTTTASSFDSLITKISKKCKDEKGKIALKDPTSMELGMAYAACMITDRTDKLYTTVVCTRSGEALGLVYSSKESIVASLECGRGVYFSRRRGLWRKGDTSGHYQTLHRLDVDCDGDALRFTVTQCGGDNDDDGDDGNDDDNKCVEHTTGPCFCHLKRFTCWGPSNGIRALEFTMKDRLKNAPSGSYTKRLFDDSELLRDKLVEEAQELAEATTKEEVAGELADVLYFAMARAVKAGVSIDDAISVLDERTRKVTRRKGDSKVFRIEEGNKILNKEDIIKE
jgi:phosphoribosyl-ATP pyrophosphohydrolase/phosphoribosyl-AMP cyclohydrolase/histidinol dehydrogenase